MPPEEKGRKSAVGYTHVCGSCEVWVQLDSSATYRERHVGLKCDTLAMSVMHSPFFLLVSSKQ